MKKAFIKKIIVSICIFTSMSSFGQEINENEDEGRRLIREGAFYLSTSSTLEITKTKYGSQSLGTNISLFANALYAIDEYVALGGLVLYDNQPSNQNFFQLTQYGIGPSIGVFLPNKSALTPYLSGSVGYSRLTIRNSRNRNGYFLTAGLGLLYEINELFGVGIEYGYSVSSYGSSSSTAKTGGIAIGFFISL